MHDLSEHPATEALEKIDKVYLVMSGKGGVGKSTVAMNLAASLHKRGKKVGVLDADLHGPSMMRMFNFVGEQLTYDENKYIIPMEKDGLKVASIAATMPDEETSTIWRGPMKIGILTQLISDVLWGELDYLVVDLPPGTGDEPLTIAQTIPSAEAIIVTTPQEISVIDVKKSINFCKKLSINICGIVENMGSIICPDCGRVITLFEGRGGERLAKEYGIPFLGSLPFEQSVTRGGDEGNSALSDGAGLASEVFNNIVDELLENNSTKENDMSNEKTKSCVIALPLEGENLSAHFGHAASFAFYTIENDEIKDKKALTPPKHEPGVLPNWIADNGANILLAGGLGGKAKEILNARGVEVVSGVSADSALDAVKSYIKDSLVASGVECNHDHEHTHSKNCSNC